MAPRLWRLMLVALFGIGECTLHADVQYTVTSDLHKVEVPHTGAIYTAFHPAAETRSKSKKPLLFFLGGSEGGIWTGNDPIVLSLRTQGYHVVTVGYFKMPGISKQLTRIDLEPFGKAIELFKKHPGVDPDRIGIVGGSKGAELALLLATRYPDIHLVATFVPSHVLFQGINIALFSHHSSWRYQGEELPFVPYDPFSWAALKGVLSGENYRDMHLQALQNREAVRTATIPVEKINGPIFLLSATRDQFWPSTPMSERIMHRLDTYGFRFPHQHVAWNSNHFILRDPKAWDTLLHFLQKQWPTNTHN